MHTKIQTRYLDDAGHVLVAMQILDEPSGILVTSDEDGSEIDIFSADHPLSGYSGHSLVLAFDIETGDVVCGSTIRRRRVGRDL